MARRPQHLTIAPEIGPAEDSSAEVAVPEVRLAQISPTEVCLFQVDVREVGVAEIKRSVLIASLPRIPRLSALPQDRQLLLVRHGSRASSSTRPYFAAG